MEEINKAMQEMSVAERTQFDSIMATLCEDMKDVKMKRIQMAHEAQTAAAMAFLYC